MGRLYIIDTELVREIKPHYFERIKACLNEPWYRELEQNGKLIRSEEISSVEADGGRSSWLKHPRLPFVTYPWEWSFSALKAAALLTLEIELQARENGYSLKDATGTNILFLGAHPIFVDVLSFVPLKSGMPWIALGQFCRSFLFPLMIQSYKKLSPQPLLLSGLGEISLDDTWRILGVSSLRRPGVFKWVYLQRLIEKSMSGMSTSSASREMNEGPLSDHQVRKMLLSLRSLVESIDWNPGHTEWACYSANSSYAEDEEGQKAGFIEEILKNERPRRVFDFGANSGKYSRLAANLSTEVYALDQDPGAIDLLQRSRIDNVWTVLGNLANPTPGIGWSSVERPSLFERLGEGFYMALALIHHLRISSGIPLDKIMLLFHAMGRSGVIEWVDREDLMVKHLLRHREDVFDDYNRENFLTVMDSLFHIKSSMKLRGETRELFWLERK
jgi:hypothetical protein